MTLPLSSKTFSSSFESFSTLYTLHSHFSSPQRKHYVNCNSIITPLQCFTWNFWHVLIPLKQPVWQAFIQDDLREPVTLTHSVTCCLSFLNFLRPIAPSSHICWVWQSFLKPHSKLSLACLCVLDLPLQKPCIFTQSFSSFVKTCPYHLNLCCCTTAVISS